ncbi:MAG: carboxymuconolactone decarboxylase family protein [Hyphomicrobium sp.]
MMIDALIARLPDYAKDVRLNLSSLVSDDTLAPQTKFGLLLACAITTRCPDLIAAFEQEAALKTSPQTVSAAKAAAAIMAMNNVYYRFLHLVPEKEYASMPARLRMNVIANPGVEKADFELWSLAVSTINGCGACIEAHEKELRKHNVPSSTIQTAVRYAAILQSVAVVLQTAEPAQASSVAAE